METPPLPWLSLGQNFPPVQSAWGQGTPAPGLLCAGGNLTTGTLAQAYQHGIFPWFSLGQPILWWSPDPRMVLDVDRFRIHPSFRKELKKFIRTSRCETRVDSDFEAVINACATSTRVGHSGTWIVPDMVRAYIDMHHQGLAHSVETWINGRLAGGLYFVAIGCAVFGESMFHRSTGSSKIALAALVAMCRQFGVCQIDCQQNTSHLASLGAAEIAREIFLQRVSQACQEPSPRWEFAPVYWNHIVAPCP